MRVNILLFKTTFCAFNLFWLKLWVSYKFKQNQSRSLSFALALNLHKHNNMGWIGPKIQRHFLKPNFCLQRTLKRIFQLRTQHNFYKNNTVHFLQTTNIVGGPKQQAQVRKKHVNGDKWSRRPLAIFLQPICQSNLSLENEVVAVEKGKTGSAAVLNRYDILYNHSRHSNKE